ncbi:hypothetical protein JXL19_03430 [bacterium]|nr:hypothetical protein [bacterium]
MEESPRTGKEMVIHALIPSNMAGGLLNKSGLISTAQSSISGKPWDPLKKIDPNSNHGGRLFNMKLHDGTKVGGLFFEYYDGIEDIKPLLIASFGFLQDRWGTEAAKFHELYLKNQKDRIPAHVLILDHPSAGPFLANNGCLSIGSYDDARMWIEVAQRFKNDMNLTGIHLLGVSMSGQTVVHALIEDKRLGLNLFKSGMAISIAPDFKKAPGKQLSQLETRPGISNPWRSDSQDTSGMTLVDKIQRESLCMLIERQFIPNYRFVYPEDTGFDIQPEDIAVLFRKTWEDRINFLRARGETTWNKDFSLEDLDSFMETTKIAGVIDLVQTPLILVSSRDDPAVEYTMFEEVIASAEGNPWIAAYQTNDGGHFGFDTVYGKDYIGQIIRLMLDSEVLHTWNSPHE